MQAISAEEFAVFAKLVLELTGISLDTGKAYLVETRLWPLVEELGLRSFGELYYKVRTDPGGTLKGKVIDRITTQETSFFRDQAPFELLRQKLIPELVAARSRSLPPGRPATLRVWSAACSTGQEPYSIAITHHEALGGMARCELSILGTDLSDAALARAARAVYTQHELERGMPEGLRSRCFEPFEGGFRVREPFRSGATFRRQNLLEDFSALGRFDIVFCRNVAIYFAEEAKRDLFDRMAGALAPDGVLILGSTESLAHSAPRLEACRQQRTLYYRLRS